MGRIHLRGVGQRQQFVMQRVVELFAQVLSRRTKRREEVWSTDIADEQRVTSEDAVRCIALVVHHDAHGFGSVTGGITNLQGDPTKAESLAVLHCHHGKLGSLGTNGPVHDVCTSDLLQLEMTGQEIGVKMRLKDSLDGETVLLGVSQVLRHVALRVDHDRTPRGGVANHVGGVRQASEVVLAEEHGHAYSSPTKCTDI